jgi:hypothetical protein
MQARAHEAQKRTLYISQQLSPDPALEQFAGHLD